MTLYIAALIAGFLTVLSPCVLPVLPIILGTSTTTSKRRDLVLITLSLAVSIFVFSLLLQTALKFTPILRDLDDQFWVTISGIIISFFGIVTIAPSLWDRLAVVFNNESHELLEKSNHQQGILKPILLGASLGPVFTSCSPTYFVILGLITSASYAQGISLLLVYLVGLSVFLYTIGLLGQKFSRKFKLLADPTSIFRKLLGVLFLLLGIGIILGWDKALETALLDQGWYSGFAEFETLFLQ